MSVATRALFTRFPQALFIILLIVGVLLHFWEPWPLPAIAHQLWVGVGLIVVALAIIGWAILEMRAKGTSPLPWQESVALVRYGPYRFSRNPIYLGDILIVFGLALILGTTWLVIASFVSLPLARVLIIRHEEEYMAERFGAEWLGYADKVRRWI